MENPYSEYYLNQAGTGIPDFSGVRFQRGRRFIGRFFSNATVPLLKFLGQNALTAAYEIAKDASNDESLPSAFRKHLTEAGINIAEKGLERARQYAQTGTGKRKKGLKRLRKPPKRQSTRHKTNKKRKNYKKTRYSSLDF